jgi:hypothetical protein
MLVKVAMSWLAKTSRWEKRVMGCRLVVSCRQLKKLGYMDLHLPETKEHSRDAANRWLADQLGKRLSGKRR